MIATRTFVIINCNPISQYQYLSPNKRYYSKRGKQFIKDFCNEINQQMKNNKWKTIDSENIECEIICFFSNKRKNDCDNFVKPILDNLEKCKVFKDDRYITRLVIEKVYQKPAIKKMIINLRNRDDSEYDNCEDLDDTIIEDEIFEQDEDYDYTDGFCVKG